MEIYLVRHTAPDIAKGTCYGQADIGVKESFLEEAAVIREHLPADVDSIYSSPLKRCQLLASHLFEEQTIHYRDNLKEINCGAWELKLWDEIPKQEIDPWMDDLLHVRMPGGESYTDVFERVAACFDQIVDEHRVKAEPGTKPGSAKAVIVAHGGVIRSILSYVTQTPLADSFKVFSLHYGCVIKLVHEEDGLRHEVLSNIQQEKETHKPSK